MFERVDESAYERTRHLKTFLVVAVILTMIVALTCGVILLDVFPRDTTEYYIFLLIVPILAYATAFWVLLYIRRATYRLRLEMESRLSIFELELSRSWEQNDALENENLRLRQKLAPRNRAAHNVDEQNGPTSE